MDAQLEQRWKDGKPPFDGSCLRLADHVPLPTLRSLLRAIVYELQQRLNHRPLLKFDDWHEHDGYITEAQPADWAALDRVLLNDESLKHSRHGDAYVRRAFYPDDLTFLLRYDVLDPDEEPELSEPMGDCDLCVDADTIGRIRAKAERLANCLEVVSAKEYFDKIYAG